MATTKTKPSNKKAKHVPACTLADLLAGPVKRAVQEQEPTECVICNKTLSATRIAALRSMNAPVNNWTCVKDSTTKKVLGQYMGEVGTSEMKIVDRIEETSVRSMFRKSVIDDDAEAESSESDDSE